MPFRDINSHRRLTELLARSIERGTLPPSSIFAGPSEEKRSTAVAVAQSLNCLQPTRGDACGVCKSCVRVVRGTHPDVLFPLPNEKGNIGIDEIRAVLEATAYRPFEGRFRVAIIDKADRLTPDAQGSLLKNLEEPPSSSIFILVTLLPDTLLSTVRSRCIRLWFAETDMAEIDAESRSAAERVLVEVANGNDARRIAIAVQELHPKGNLPPAVARKELAPKLRAVASLLRDVEVLSAGADEGAIANKEAQPVLERLAAAFKGGRAARAFAAVDQALLALNRNAAAKIVADWVALQL